MTKKTIFLIIILHSIVSLLFADVFVVKSFIRLDNDISARRYEKKDVNGDACALIKVRTDIREHIQFDSNLGIPHAAELKESGEWWVYVSPGERALKLMAEGFIMTTAPLSGEGQIKSNLVYEFVLTSKDIEARSIEKDLFILTFSFNVDGVYIKKDNTAAIKTTGTISGFELAKGIYHFTFQKEGYKTLEDTIHVNQSSQRDIKLSRGFSDYQAGLPGIIIISSEPSDAEIYLNDQYIGVTPYQGEIYEGDYILRVSKEFYYDVENSFIMTPKMTKQIPPITLKSNYGYLSLQSTPPVSDIYLNGSFIDKTPLIKYQLTNGLYDLTIKKELHRDLNIQIRIENFVDRKEDYRLEALFGAFKVDCKNVTEVEVYLNTRLIGRTPLQLDTLEFGTYDLLIRKELYKDFTERIDVSASLTERNVFLLQNHGTLDIAADGCDIYVNDQLIGKNKIIKTYLPGTHQVKAIMDDIHYPVEEEVFLGNGETRHLIMEPKYITGSIAIMTNPIEASGADIYVNDVLQNMKAPAILSLLIGTHTIVIKHPNFLDITLNQIVIQENAYINKTFTMQTYKGSLKQKENFWKTQMWIALGSTVVISGVGGAGGNYMGWETFFDYQDASSVSEAIRLRNTSDMYFLGRDISYGVSISSLLYAGFSLVQELRFKEMQKEGIGFLEKIFGTYKPK